MSLPSLPAAVSAQAVQVALSPSTKYCARSKLRKHSLQRTSTQLERACRLTTRALQSEAEKPVQKKRVKKKGTPELPTVSCGDNPMYDSCRSLKPLCHAAGWLSTNSQQVFHTRRAWPTYRRIWWVDIRLLCRTPATLAIHNRLASCFSACSVHTSAASSC